MIDECIQSLNRNRCGSVRDDGARTGPCGGGAIHGVRDGCGDAHDCFGTAEPVVFVGLAESMFALKDVRFC